MKKQIIILFLFSIHLQSYCQAIKITVSCNDSVLMSFKGKWKKVPDNIFPDNTLPFLTKAQYSEVYSRLDAVHRQLQEAYPDPTGNEAGWWRNLFSGLFAGDVNQKKGIPLYGYSYYCAFGPYSCLAYRPKEVAPGGGETSTWFRVYANDFSYFSSGIGSASDMTVNGQPVYWRDPVKGKWKGYELYGLGDNDRSVLLTRHGQLPYTPVTRKQYLDYAIARYTKDFDDVIKRVRESPVRSLEEQETEKKKALDKIEEDYKNNPKSSETVRNMYLGNYETDQQQRDKQVTIQVNLKENILKRFGEEIERSRASNLLDSAAIIIAWLSWGETFPIFSSDDPAGRMLIIDNSAYIRKDLSRTSPQFMILHWSWNEDAQGNYYRKMLEANFPIEKLQAMIDK
jgi:hypothetical protein